MGLHHKKTEFRKIKTKLWGETDLTSPKICLKFFIILIVFVFIILSSTLLVQLNQFVSVNLNETKHFIVKGICFFFRCNNASFPNSIISLIIRINENYCLFYLFLVSCDLFRQH